MLSTALFCLTIIIPALGDIRLVNMTTDDIHIIGTDVETLFIIVKLRVRVRVKVKVKVKSQN